MTKITHMKLRYFLPIFWTITLAIMPWVIFGMMWCFDNLHNYYFDYLKWVKALLLGD